VLKPGDVISLGEQIVLMYDAINVDPGATVAVSRKAVRVEPPPVQSSAPSYTPPPASYSPPSTPVASVKKTNLTPIIIGVGALLFICMCAGFFFWVDATYRWCTFFPFITGC
jgi:hypothetical protein